MSIAENAGWRLVAGLPSEGRALLIERDPRADAVALTGLGLSVVALFPNSSGHLAPEKVWKGFSARRELTDRIEFSFSEGLADVPFSNETFSLIVVADVEDVARRFNYRGSSWLTSEKVIGDLRRFLTPDGEVFVSFEGASLKSILKRKRIGLPFCWLTWRLKKSMEVNTVMDYYPDLGDVIMVRDNIGKTTRARNARRGIRAILKSEGTGVICRKSTEAVRRTIASEILIRLGEKRDYGDPSAYRIDRGSAGVFVLHTENTIVRFPRLRFPQIVKRWSRNFEALCSLSGVSLPCRIPEPLLMAEIGKQVYSVESKLQGVTRELKNPSGPESGKFPAQVLEFQTALFRQTSRISVLDEKEFQRLFQAPMNRLAAYCDEEGKKKLLKMQTRFRETFLSTSFPLVRTHGDFKRSNFIFGKWDNLDGVFDWDLSVSAGLPLLDLYLFLGFEKSSGSKRDVTTAILEDFVAVSPLGSPFVLQYLQQTYWMSDLKARHLAFLTVVYYFAYHLLGFVTEPTLRDDVSFAVMRGAELLESVDEDVQQGYRHDL